MVLRLLELKHGGSCSNVKFLLLQLFPRLKVIFLNAMEEKKGHCHRRSLTSVSNVCEAAPISLFWAASRLNELLEMYFQFPFILIGKSTMAFLTGQSCCILKCWYTGIGGVRTRILALFCKQT